MCGIVGVILEENSEDIGMMLKEGLSSLNHRGEEAAGISVIRRLDMSRKDYRRRRNAVFGNAVNQYNTLKTIKGHGLVREVLQDKQMKNIYGFMGIGQVRYPTSGYTLESLNLEFSESEFERLKLESSQPLVQEWNRLAMVHNGDLEKESYKQIITEFKKNEWEIDSTNDLEALGLIFNNAFFGLSENLHSYEKLQKSVTEVLEKVKGTYSVASILNNVGLLAFRDSNGRRPLFRAAMKKNNKITGYAIASETIALEAMGFTGEMDEILEHGKNAYREVKPGKMFYVSKDFEEHEIQIKETHSLPCPFEFAYFMDSASFFNRKRVDTIRENVVDYMWERFSEQNQNLYEYINKNKENSIVVAVPRTAETAANRLSHISGIKYERAIKKRNDAGRIFQMSNQKLRESNTKSKHDLFGEKVKDKYVVVVDDSMVRGTTAIQDTKMLQEAGAKGIFWMFTFPPIIHPCNHAIDFKTQQELIAYNHNGKKALMTELGLLGSQDYLMYANPEELKKASGLDSLCNECYGDGLLKK
ncbi:hypothetical protein K9L67_02365 [Candidatus Woesearchaeota archaeon]|nr:hypothetical protein [Candidatus Woesearchaeota archaeon]MCF7901049.1 hypothetical protein [Candidatus Woesearchaeota archaeon]MCF8013946.1 hypothetical protein [Candidatus Woesearchaeota archaeon]